MHPHPVWTEPAHTNSPPVISAMASFAVSPFFAWEKHRHSLYASAHFESRRDGFGGVFGNSQIVIASLRVGGGQAAMRFKVISIEPNGVQ